MTTGNRGYCSITFLSCEDGTGYRASIRGRIGDFSNWSDSGYSDLKGVALEPTDDDTSDVPWLQFVRAQLAKQGVKFVPNSG